jgi:hypothetical protein
MRRTRQLNLVLAGCVLAGLSAPASAAFWWEFGSSGFSNAACAGTNNVACPWGNSRGPSSTSSGAPTVSATAWSNTGGTNPNTSATTGTIEDAYLASWSGGLGVINRDAATLGTTIGPSGGGNTDDREGADPEHATDSDQRVDAVLFSFSESVKLTSMRAGWAGSDSDVTVLAYTGAGSPGPTGSWGALPGWTFVGNYLNIGTSSTAINAGGLSSAYWMITGGNTAYGLTYDGKDYVKILKLVGDPGQRVPEPGSLALLGLGAFGLWRMRRKG